MTRKLDNGNGKFEVMEEEHEKLYQQCKTLTKQARSCNNQIHQLEQENIQLKEFSQNQKEAAGRKEAEWQSRQASYEQSIDDLRRRLALIERMERKEEESIANSKATTQSVLTNI